MNKVIISGNVGKDPDIRATQGGMKIAEFSVATSDYVGKKDDKPNYETTWHNVKVFGPVVDMIAKQVKKGSKVLVEGKIRVESWTPKDGGDKKYKNVVSVGMNGTVEVLGSASGNGSSGSSAAAAEEDTDDIPF